MFEKYKGVLRELAFSKLGLELTDSQIDKLCLYGDSLLEWNHHVNLTSITDPQEIIVKHFIDSLSLGKYLTGSKLADIGTGAGFPGIPLKIVFSHLEITLVDSLVKRLDFLNQVIIDLKLENIQTVHARAEDFGRNPSYRESFAIVTARAVARLNVLLEYCLPILKIDGLFVAAKGSQYAEEINESSKALEILGGKIEAVQKFSLGEEAEHRALIIVRKVSSTPAQYPRKAGTPVKKPLI